MHNILVKPLPAGCRLTAVFDSCHSGSAIDLPWAYSTKGTVKSPNLIANAAPDLMNAGMAALSGNDMGALYTLFQAGSTAYRTHTGVANARATKTAPADVIAWGGCKDDQTSADTKAEGQATGAMSYAFVRAVQSNPRASYQQFLVALRDAMVKGGYSQKPQLSACHGEILAILVWQGVCKLTRNQKSTPRSSLLFSGRNGPPAAKGRFNRPVTLLPTTRI